MDDLETPEGDALAQFLGSSEDGSSGPAGGNKGADDSYIELHMNPEQLSLGELDLTSEDVDLSGLEEELQKYGDHDIVRGILRKGSDVKEHVREVDVKLRQVELDSIQDYILESDNLVTLQEQIKTCDGILEAMEDLLGGFQSDLGNISTEIKTLQEQSLSMSIKLRNRKAAEAELGKFVKGLTIPPTLVSDVLEKEVNEDYLQYLTVLHEKLEFCSNDELARKAAALQDVEPEVEKLRLKAVGRVRDFLLGKFNQLRKPKTNIQIIQQNVLLKYKNFNSFLKQHGPEVFPELRSAYVDTMGRVYKTAITSYMSSLSRIQHEVATRNDLIGVEELGALGLFARARDTFRNRTSVFALGNRAAVLNNLADTPPLVIHSVAASGERHPYEVLFRSTHKLLMDASCSEYLFCVDFWRADGKLIFKDVFEGALQSLSENLAATLPSCYDTIGLLLMIRVNYEHQLIMQKRRVPCLDAHLDKVNLMLWPRLKATADLHIKSLQNANVRALWGEDVHAHYITRRFAELTASLLSLNTDYGDHQVERIAERVRSAFCELLLKLAEMPSGPKAAIVFLVNNYDCILTVLREAGLGPDGTPDRDQTYAAFEELMQAQIHDYVEEELASHFAPFITFLRKSETAVQKGEAEAVNLAEAKALLRDFADRWKGAIEQMHKDSVTQFGSLQRGMDLLQRTLSQLLIYYTRFTGSEGVLVRIGPEGAALCKEAISHPAFIYEIKLKLKL